MPATTTPAPTGALFEIEGVLINDAQVRQQACDHGSARPVLVLDIDRVGPGLHRVHVEQPYDAASSFAADALALQLKRGTRVRVQASFSSALLTLPKATAITPITA